MTLFIEPESSLKRFNYYHAMVHFHLKFELINAVVWYPKMFFGIDASVAVAPVVNPTSIISLFLSDVITFFIS